MTAVQLVTQGDDQLPSFLDLHILLIWSKQAYRA